MCSWLLPLLLPNLRGVCGPLSNRFLCPLLP